MIAQLAGQQQIAADLLLAAQRSEPRTVTGNRRLQRAALLVQRGNLLRLRRQVGHEHPQDVVELAARSGHAYHQRSGGQGTALGHLDRHFIGNDVAVRGLPDDHLATDEHTVVRPLYVDAAMQRGQRRAGGQPVDDDVAFLIARAAADQVGLQADDPAARKDLAENVRVGRDTATLDDSLLLDLAVLLVHFAGQQEIAGRAHADPLVTDDLVGDRKLVTAAIDGEKATYRRHQVFSVRLPADTSAGAGQALQVEIPR